MLSKRRLKELNQQKLVASARVVPVPLTSTWCVDVVVRTPLAVGSATETVAEAGRDRPRGELRTFKTIDDAARFLREVDISSFVVDTSDSVSFTAVDAPMPRVVETTMRIWSDDEDAPTAGTRPTDPSNIALSPGL